ncbi:MAG: diphthamide biosynthesis enzyme Dph2 [Candidatus Nanohaloarchaeota archaeon QJJ-7]|nr:diphthamide biosynthesis enzyme Dph2 [Candidatus Nanohaloarchaeota archaeon QJJ-7]
MELEEALDKVEREGYESVGLQGPAGLKGEMLEIAEELEDRGVEPLLLAEATFGGCDLADHKVEELGGEALVHLGHSPFYLGSGEVSGDNIDVLHVPYRLDRDFVPVLEEEADRIEEEKLGVLTTAQHTENVDEVMEWLNENGFDAVRGGKGSRVRNEGQVLGCDAGAALSIKDEVDAFLYVGSGKFHPEQIARHGKTYVLDPVQNNLEELEALSQDEYLQQQYARVLKHKDTENWGVIATIKEQQPGTVVDYVKDKLEEHGKNVHVFVGDRIMESDFKGFDIDIFVNTACPRMVDDFEDFTLVNPEALNVLDEVRD